MVKETASWETVEKLLLKGYKCRIKTTKDKKYLSARKADDEKGLGPFSQEIWDRIQTFKIQATTNDTNEGKTSDASLYAISLVSAKRVPTPIVANFNRNEIEDALFKIKYERARIKTSNCKYRRFESCGYWEFLKDTENLDKIYQRFDKNNALHPLFIRAREQSIHLPSKRVTLF